MKNMKLNCNSLYQKYLKYIFLVIAMGIINPSFGQSKHEVSVYLSGLFSKLDYAVGDEESDMNTGVTSGVGYLYNFKKKWGISSGVALQYLEGGLSGITLNDNYNAIDSEGEEFEFRYTITNYSEMQKLYFINVPIKLQFETEGITRFYASGGVKIGFLIDSKYELSGRNLSTSGYYSQYDVELKKPEFAGFGDFGVINKSGSDLDLKTNIVLSFESGAKFMLEYNKAFYIGAFIDYGLTNIKADKSDKNLLAYNSKNPTDFKNNSLLVSRNSQNAINYVEEIKTLAFGFKMRYAFQL